MHESNLFYLWLVDKDMIHVPTQRFKGFLCDTCNGGCVDQKVCVGINCLPSTNTFSMNSRLLPYDNTVKYQCWVYIVE